MSDETPSSPFSVPIFRAVWLASMASNFGGLIQSVGASWMMVQIHASPLMIALVQTSTTLPIMLLSLWAGAIADNLDRRKVLLAAQSFMLVISLILSLCAWFGVLTPWLLLALTFLVGCGTAINAPAWQASVGDMVPRALLPSAVSYNAMGFNIARSAGPALGGAIVAVGGAAAAFLANALSYMGLITVLARWKPDVPASTLPRERLIDAMGAGVRYAMLSPPIRRVMLRAAVFSIGASAIPALMPVIASKVILGGPLTYGLLLGSFGVGAVIGAFSSGQIRKRFTTENLTRASTLAMILGALVVAFSHWLPLTMLALIPAGAGWVLALSTFNVSVQMAAPRWVVARAVALYQMAAFGGLAMGSWLFGSIADHHGAVTSLHVAAGALLISTILGFFAPLPPISDENLDLHLRWREPDIAVEVTARSGPVVITIEHHIAEWNIPPFIAVMNERKRIRLRDGARGWTLLRDLNDPRLWFERYHVPTWLDYVRHNQRRTHADIINSEELHALWIDGKPPVVHRMIERDVGSLLRPHAQDHHPEPTPISEAMTDPTRSS